MTINATTAMTTISLKPISNMNGALNPAYDSGAGRARRSRRLRRPVARRLRGLSGLVLPDLAFDGRARNLLRRALRGGLLGIGVGFGALHTLLEALHRATQILTD